MLPRERRHTGARRQFLADRVTLRGVQGCRPAKYRTLGPGASQAGLRPLNEQVPLELSNRRDNTHRHAARGAGQVNAAKRHAMNPDAHFRQLVDRRGHGESGSANDHEWRRVWNACGNVLEYFGEISRRRWPRLIRWPASIVGGGVGATAPQSSESSGGGRAGFSRQAQETIRRSDYSGGDCPAFGPATIRHAGTQDGSRVVWARVSGHHNGDRFNLV